MESHEVMKKAVNKVGAKAVASEMSLSASLIYKWCEPNDAPDAGGADNPLDRLEKICSITGDTGPIEWLCGRAGGFMVKNPEPGAKKDRMSLLLTTQKILKEFTELLEAVSVSFDDSRIDSREAGKIRAEWEDLKGIAEGFVVACEKGQYEKAGS